MKKAAAKAEQPVSLGTKRVCPKCATKFYDFNKTELSCPKCKTDFSVEELKQATAPILETKKSRAVEKAIVDEPLVAQSEETAADAPDFESVDDLGDDDEIDVEVENEDEEAF